MNRISLHKGGRSYSIPIKLNMYCIDIIVYGVPLGSHEQPLCPALFMPIDLQR